MTEPDASAPFVDVSNMPLGELFASTDPNLLATLKRLTASLDDPSGIISAFQSLALNPPPLAGLAADDPVADDREGRAS